MVLDTQNTKNESWKHGNPKKASEEIELVNKSPPKKENCRTDGFSAESYQTFKEFTHITPKLLFFKI